MAKIDKQKEIIGIYKTGFFFVLGALFALLAYIFQNFDKLNNNKMILLEILILIGVSVIMLIVKKLKENLDKLEEL